MFWAGTCSEEQRKRVNVDQSGSHPPQRLISHRSCCGVKFYFGNYISKKFHEFIWLQAHYIARSSFAAMTLELETLIGQSTRTESSHWLIVLFFISDLSSYHQYHLNHLSYINVSIEAIICLWIKLFVKLIHGRQWIALGNQLELEDGSWYSLDMRLSSLTQEASVFKHFLQPTILAR